MFQHARYLNYLRWTVFGVVGQTIVNYRRLGPLSHVDLFIVYRQFQATSFVVVNDRICCRSRRVPTCS